MTSLTHPLFPPLVPGDEPLRKRSPKTDENGRPLSDFMMLFPGLRNKPAKDIKVVMIAIQGVLARFERDVIFAEVNLKLNLLWVTIRPVQSLRLEIAEAIQLLVPDAKLVSHI